MMNEKIEDTIRSDIGKQENGRTLWKIVFFCMTSAVLSVLICACQPPYVINTNERNYAIDFRNTIFNATDETDPSQRGLGIDEIHIDIVTLSDSGDEVTTTVAISSDDLTAGSDYSQVEITIDGKLMSVAATADSFTALINDENIDDTVVSAFNGWTEFANTSKLKLDYSVNTTEPENSMMRLLVCPRGGNSPSVFIDSGPPAAETNTGLTDRSADIVSLQIALGFEFAEFVDEDLKYGIYTQVVNENLAVVYNEALNNDALYIEDPWSDRWSYNEIISDGRFVGGTLYKMAQDTLGTSGTYSAVDPQNDGYESFLLDLTLLDEENLNDKYLLVGIILYYGSLSAPLDVLCIDIE